MAMSTRSLRSSRLRPLVAAAAVLALWMPVDAVLPAQSAQQLYLTVLDDDGNPVVDLRPYEISVAENGVRREVLYLARPSGPADVSILVDTSEAVVPSTTHVRRALGEFVVALDGYARMSLMTFGDLPVRVVPPTTRLSVMQEAVDRVFPAVGAIPRFQDALIQTVRDIQNRQPSRPTLVIITSDQVPGAFATESPNTSARPVQQVVGVLQAIGAPVHIVALRSSASFDIVGRGVFDRASAFSGTADNNMRNSIMARETRDWLMALETASQSTGGRLVNTYASAGLATPLLEIANEIAGQYILTYSRPELPLDTDTIDIQIGIAREDVTVRVTPVV